jgi:BirA family biotin operon repressor/biotin-[acetyl-CoA-carboxylase] ligase
MTNDERVIGRRTVYFDTIDSTNSYALGLAHDPGQDGLAVIAREQTAGRGQHGRAWSAPPGSSVLMSLLLFPPPPLRRPALLTAWAAVSVCRLIRQITGIHAQLKWPNDVLIGGRKVCGILIEQRSAGADGLATVAGIGLNVTQPAQWFTTAGLNEGTSLASLTGDTLVSRAVADRLIVQLDDEYRRLLAGDRRTLETLWRQHLGLDGAEVSIEWTGEVLQGRLVNAAFDGLDVEIAGKLVRLQPELVRHIKAGR